MITCPSSKYILEIIYLVKRTSNIPTKICKYDKTTYFGYKYPFQLKCVSFRKRGFLSMNNKR